MIRPLRQDLKLLTDSKGPGGSPAWLLHDLPRNRFFRLGWLESEMLRRWSSVDSISQLAERINQETTLKISELQVKKFISFLTNNQLIQPQSEQETGTNGQMPQRNTVYEQFKAERDKTAGWFGWLLHHYLFFPVPLLRPDKLLTQILKRLPWIVHPGFLLLAMLSGVVGLYLVSRRWDVFLATFPQLFSWQGMLTLALAIFLAKAIHELGHALLAKHYGCQVPTMGVAFLVMWPVLYADTSDLWRLSSRKKRLNVVVAGVTAELALAGVATLLWNFTHAGPLQSALLALATATWITTLIINANPLMRFDGYFFLSDWLDIANLQERSFAMGRWQLRRLLLGLHDGPPEQFSRSRQKFIIFFAWAVWIYRFLLFLGIALLVYHIFFKVLGLFLMLVEIYWFILKPILRELGFWIKNRSRLNRGAVSTLALLFIIITGIVVIPWQGRIILPAVLRSQTFTSLYPPTATQVLQTHVQVGMRVGHGDRLFTLESPYLKQKLALNRLDRERFLHDSQRSGIKPSDREQRLVAVQLLATAQANYKGFNSIQEQLHITAPFSGVIMQLADDITPGRWLGHEQPLAYLHQPGSEHIRAYVDENHYQDVTVGQKGRFFPDDPGLSTFPVRVVDVDPSAIPSLEWPYLASVYDGPLAVRKGNKEPLSGASMTMRRDNGQRLFPEEALYRIHLDLEATSTLIPEAILLGKVSLPGKKQSIAEKVWQVVMAVLIRESGF